MNRGDTRPFEDQRLGVPGTGTESEADQHLRGMVKNQLDTNVTLEGYDTRLILGLSYFRLANFSGSNGYNCTPTPPLTQRVTIS